MKSALMLFGLAFGTVSVGNLSAAVLSQYTFPLPVAAGETGAAYNSMTTAGGVVASAVTDAGANIVMNTELGAYATPFLKLKPTNAGAPVTTAAASLANNSYATFTLSTAGTFNLSSFTFDASRGGASLTRGFVIQSSIGGFGSGGAILLQVDSIPTQQGAGGPTANFTPYSIDLSAASFQGLTNVEFRIYAFSDGTGASVDFDNLTLNGTVPEPAALLLGGMGLGAACVRRFRRR
jgi:hypothetical protein